MVPKPMCLRNKPHQYLVDIVDRDRDRDFEGLVILIEQSISTNIVNGN